MSGLLSDGADSGHSRERMPYCTKLTRGTFISRLIAFPVSEIVIHRQGFTSSKASSLAQSGWELRLQNTCASLQTQKLLSDLLPVCVFCISSKWNVQLLESDEGWMSFHGSQV
eukprot:6486900-Amphidinium_carterae.4